MFSFICSFAYTGCINAPRDNKYDPDNPDKAEMTGGACEPDGRIIAGANADLMHDYNDEVVRSDTSDSSGSFYFDKIDPGIYRIHALAPHFSGVYTGPESLWGGTRLDGYRLYFTTFHFEDDAEGAMPYGFSNITGRWAIARDPSQANEHSAPNVSRGANIGAYDPDPSLAIFRSKAQYPDLEVKLKVLSSSGSQWQTGIVFRYQDKSNYYFVKMAPDTAEIGFKKDNNITIVADTSLTFLTETWYTLKISCDSLFTSVCMNDSCIFRTYTFAYVFPDGSFGMLVSSREPGVTATVNFDDIFVDYKLQ
jgi:hypothetical protein